MPIVKTFNYNLSIDEMIYMGNNSGSCGNLVDDA